MAKSTAVAKVKPHNLSHLQRDRGYRFVERDPILEEVCHRIDQSGLSSWQIEQRCGVTRNTINKWLAGGVKKPQNLTVDFVLKALGFERVIQPISGVIQAIGE